MTDHERDALRRCRDLQGHEITSFEDVPAARVATCTGLRRTARCTHGRGIRRWTCELVIEHDGSDDMKRTARLLEPKTMICYPNYTLSPPTIDGVSTVTVRTEPTYTEIIDPRGLCKRLLCTSELLSDAEALARIGYTLEKPVPVLELGEETAEPTETDFYWIESDKYVGKVFVDADLLCKRLGWGWERLSYYPNARWRRFIVKEAT